MGIGSRPRRRLGGRAKDWRSITDGIKRGTSNRFKKSVGSRFEQDISNRVTRSVSERVKSRVAGEVIGIVGERANSDSAGRGKTRLVLGPSR